MLMQAVKTDLGFREAGGNYTASDSGQDSVSLGMRGPFMGFSILKIYFWNIIAKLLGSGNLTHGVGSLQTLVNL